MELWPVCGETQGGGAPVPALPCAQAPAHLVIRKRCFTRRRVLVCVCHFGDGVD